jgi:hypothetical protein
MMLNRHILLENKLLHLRANKIETKTKVSLHGNKTVTRGLLEELPGDDWHDNAARTPCPACHEFMPLGALECLNWNCKAAFFYLQHRFTAKTERVFLRAFS